MLNILRHLDILNLFEIDLIIMEINLLVCYLDFKLKVKKLGA